MKSKTLATTLLVSKETMGLLQLLVLLIRVEVEVEVEGNILIEFAIQQSTSVHGFVGLIDYLRY
jgi:hypothetical protein